MPASSTRGRADMPPRRGQNGGGAGAGGGGGGGRRRSALGLVVRVTPDGVVPCTVPSGSMRRIQPLKRVFSRWWMRHRQHRFVQVVSPPWACGMTWSWSATPARPEQKNQQQPQTQEKTNSHNTTDKKKQTEAARRFAPSPRRTAFCRAASDKV